MISKTHIPACRRSRFRAAPPLFIALLVGNQVTVFPTRSSYMAYIKSYYIMTGMEWTGRVYPARAHALKTASSRRNPQSTKSPSKGSNWRFDTPQASEMGVVDHHSAKCLPTESSMIPSTFRLENGETEGQDTTTTWKQNPRLRTKQSLRSRLSWKGVYSS